MDGWRDVVAPHAGAWIETGVPEIRGDKGAASRLTQARGLKRVVLTHHALGLAVAPHAGAWIETWCRPTKRGRTVASRLTQARGLKPGDVYAAALVQVSRLTQARGLKHRQSGVIDALPASRLTQARGLKHPRPVGRHANLQVAPHAGAWIETPGSPCARRSRSGRASRRRVD